MKKFLVVLCFLLFPSVSFGAIAFDAATNGGSTGSGTSHTFAHTTGVGSNRLLVVQVTGDNNPGDVITGVTYNSVSMTLVTKNLTAGRAQYMFYLLNPDSGANNVVISASATIYISSMAASYTGVGQSGQPDASNTCSESGSTLTCTVTTVADNSWTVLVGGNGNGATAGAGTTVRVQKGNENGNFIADSNADITPAGSTSLIITNDGAGDYEGIMASFSPPAVAAPLRAPDDFGFFGLLQLFIKKEIFTV